LIYRGHSRDVTAVAWSPDGNRLASGAYDRTIQVWNATDGSHVFTYQKHRFDAATALAWSPDGKRIASAVGVGVYIWDANDGGHELAYRDHGPAVDIFSTVAWSPDGRHLACASGYPSYQGIVYVLDALSGSDVFLYRGYEGPVSLQAIAWSPDGKRIASGGSDGTVQVWDAFTGANRFIYKGHVNFRYDFIHSGSITAVAWSPDGTRIASAGIDSTVQIWHALGKGGHVLVYRGHPLDKSDGLQGFPRGVRWSSDRKRLASIGQDLQIWDAANGQTLSTYPGAKSPLAWSPDDKRLAFASDDQTVQIWEILL
jgi:WD40 repeat protein